MPTSLPNLLTLSRIFAIPVLIVLFLYDGATTRWLALGVFAAACITDFLDGYLARTRQLQTDFGRFLDPIADKLLVAAILVLLVAYRRVGDWGVVPALVILCREILISGLREYLAGLGVALPVSALAKWKTAIQMLAIGFLIVGDAGPGWIPATLIGVVGLWLAAVLTVATGADYLRFGLKHVTAGESKV